MRTFTFCILLVSMTVLVESFVLQELPLYREERREEGFKRAARADNFPTFGRLRAFWSRNQALQRLLANQNSME
ncbi:unnamed protein product [Bursaphelenchus xylophilus]|uniref:(pine wood nematode) hypothetical protein n=1 Tax=Bursaphelenchus xylophilus TaxID=6326 RepID=A0A1I7RPQ8_BURXY|nr:unnamed protein product [Bursaphelenchus xylophilus]CAG9096459.1 unnamed protein product [Bursaphelenchus xylophilus]